MEKTLSLPLSGEEVRGIIKDKLDKHLAKDCYLTPNSAYSHFEATITVHIRLTDVGEVREVKASIAAEEGEAPEEGEEGFEGEFTIEPDAPNTLRQESGLGIPTLSTDTDGRKVIKTVKYARNIKGKK